MNVKNCTVFFSSGGMSPQTRAGPQHVPRTYSEPCGETWTDVQFTSRAFSLHSFSSFWILLLHVLSIVSEQDFFSFLFFLEKEY